MTQLPMLPLALQVPEGSKLDQGSQTGADQGAATTAQEGAPTSGEGRQEQPQGGFMSTLPFLLLIGAFFWFVLIGPERKRRKKHEALLSNLKKGDEVITGAGLYGKVVQIQDQVVTLQVADGVRMRFSIQAVQGIAGGQDDGGAKPDEKQKDEK